MKNKKIIVLTSFIILLTVVGIYGLSKAFESNWASVENKENNIKSENDGYTIQDIGAFKYITPEEYLSTIENENERLAFLANLTEVDDKMISYEEAAIIGGTSLEKVFPTTDFRNKEFKISPEKWKTPFFNDEKTFIMGSWSKRNADNHPTDPSRLLEEYLYQIDAYTGELVYIDAFFAESDLKSDMDKDQAGDYAKELARLFGYTDWIKYYIEEAEYGIDGKIFSVIFLINEEKAVGFNFNTYGDSFIMSVSEKGTAPNNLVEKYGV